MGKAIAVFICGVQKGGTTSLDAYFREHGELSAPRRKELHFFDNESHDWLSPSYSALEAAFAPDDGDRLRYEATPIYSFWAPSIARIFAYNPAAKLIFLFRDPFDRAWSHWCMEYARGDETLSFADAIREGRSRLDGVSPVHPRQRVYTYLERGLYSRQVRGALQYFPRERLLFLRSNDLLNDRLNSLAAIASFLNIAPFPNSQPKRENARPNMPLPPPTEADRHLVADFVRNDMLEFSALTGLDISDWAVMEQTPVSRPSKSQHRMPAGKKPNVLFIVADDLNSWIGALGRQSNVRTPAIDALARRGTLFSRAYCAAPYCNASRMSVFTGCLPSTTGVYANEKFWDLQHRRKTYVEALREAGYYTFGSGKVFHGVYDYAHAGKSREHNAKWVTIENRPHLWDRFETSAPEPLPANRPLNGLFNFDHFEDVPPSYHHFDWGPLPEQAELETPDEFVCRSVMEFFRQPPPEPFFCAAGLYKPHLPWHVPQRFFDMYDPRAITLPVVRDDDLDDVPALAKKWALSPQDHKLIVSRGQWHQAVQGYLAAISYCDWIIGRIIESLDRSGLAENTVIVFWGDNGFHLGEKLHWRKFVLWEEATRVPMIIVPSGTKAVRPLCNVPVGLIDLFPTIFDLCGIEGPQYPDGQSLFGAMTEEHWPGSPVIMIWGRGNQSVRAGEWRYTQYQDGSEELYNHCADPNEWNNLAGDVRFLARVEQLRGFIKSGQ